MNFEEYEKQLEKAVKNGEIEAAVLDRHINVTYLPKELNEFAKQYKVKKSLMDEYGIKNPVFSSSVEDKQTIHYNRFSTEFGLIVANYVSPHKKGDPSIVFWNWIK